ncbi:hypothetical protein [Nocardia sp. NPDC052566]|uniref:hypothetical protein n=1 Tax=Nocardia sp. NPDC052566 TaxID=3364330 RepID=UPI0037CAAE32
MMIIIAAIAGGPAMSATPHPPLTDRADRGTGTGERRPHENLALDATTRNRPIENP